MATIKKRTRDSGVRYTEEIRIKSKGEIIHRESKTFSKRADAVAWSTRRETELKSPGGLERTKHRKLTVGDLIQRYLDDYGDEFGRSKYANLVHLKKHAISDHVATELTAADIVDHIRIRRKSGAAPPTCLNDVIALRAVYKAARSSSNIPVNLQPIEDANDFLRREGMISKPGKRDRRPTHEELMKLSRHFWKQQQRARSSYPMFDLFWFAIYSCRREGEICRLRWDDNNDKELTGLVRDAKHPTAKKGNHRRFKYTRIGWRLVNRQPKNSEFIFPYDPKTISVYFTRACHLLGIEDLRFHDLRHEACSRLFEAGYDIVEVQLFSLHENWNTLRNYTHLQPGKVKLRD